MMLDALRAAKVMPGFRAAIALHLVEISPALERLQRQALSFADVPMSWHRSIEEVPDGPLIVLANEFFDALPIHQAVMCADGWHERVIKIGEDDAFQFSIERDPIPLFDKLLPRNLSAAQIGEIFEWRADKIALEIGRRVVRFGGAALIIDYGHVESAIGDTLQAVGRHEFADPLLTPGEVDLTAHVDFQALAQAAESMGARVHGPVRKACCCAGSASRSARPRSRRARRRTMPPRSRRRWFASPMRIAPAWDACSRRSPCPTRSSRPCPASTPERSARTLSACRTKPSPCAAPLMTVAASMLQAPALAALAGIRHAFFTRDGGVSDGIYASLNGGPGSEDAPANVAENRARMAATLGVRPDRLLTAYQIHSPDVVTVERPWRAHERPRADAIVTRTPGLAIGVTTADCGPVLFADAAGRRHRRGPCRLARRATGVLEATIAAMERCGADRARIVAALGPMIRQPNYEVGPEFVARFTAEDGANARFFKPSPRPDHALFDLPGYIAARLARAGVARVEDSAIAPMAIPTRSSATAARSIARSPTTGVTSMP